MAVCVACVPRFHPCMPILVTRDAEYESRESRDEAALVYRRCAEENGATTSLGRQLWSQGSLVAFLPASLRASIDESILHM